MLICLSRISCSCMSLSMSLSISMATSIFISEDRCLCSAPCLMFMFLFLLNVSVAVHVHDNVCSYSCQCLSMFMSVFVHVHASVCSCLCLCLSMFLSVSVHVHASVCPCSFLCLTMFLSVSDQCQCLSPCFCCLSILIFSPLIHCPMSKVAVQNICCLLSFVHCSLSNIYIVRCPMSMSTAHKRDVPVQSVNRYGNLNNGTEDVQYANNVQYTEDGNIKMYGAEQAEYDTREHIKMGHCIGTKQS